MSSSKKRYLFLLAALMSMAIVSSVSCNNETDIANETENQATDPTTSKGDVVVSDDIQINAICNKLGIKFGKECDLCGYFGWYGDGVPDYNLVRIKVCKKWDTDIAKDPVTLEPAKGLTPISEIAIKLGLGVGASADLCAYYGWYSDGQCDRTLIDLGICKKWDLDCGEDPYKTTEPSKDLVCKAGEFQVPETPKTGKTCKRDDAAACGEGETCWVANTKTDTYGLCVKRCCPAAEPIDGNMCTFKGEKQPSVCILNFGKDKPAGCGFVCFVKGETAEKDLTFPCPDPETQDCNLEISSDALQGIKFCGAKKKS